MQKSKLILVLAATLIALVPFINRADAQTTGDYAGSLDALTVVADDTDVAGYVRTMFGPAWKDVDHNGCDTRNDTLARDLDAPVLRTGSNCVVESGVLRPDLYTGTDFVWNKGDQPGIDIDHIIPLARAWDMGAASWTDEARANFANDPELLLATSGSVNRAKGDKSPMDWMPSNAAFVCTYSQKYIDLSTKYELSITVSDKAALSDGLATCPTDEVTPEPTTTPTAEPTTPEVTPQPTVEPPMFKTCIEAADANFYNIHSPHPAYGTHLDRDGDGVACENKNKPHTYAAAVNAPTEMPSSGV